MPIIDAPTAAIIGASITAIVALVGIVINNYIQYLNTKASIRARRTEITLNKRLDAFAKVGSSLSRVNANVKRLRMARLLKKPENEVEKLLQELYDSLNTMIDVYHDSIIYFTKRVNDIFGDFNKLFAENSTLFELLGKQPDILDKLEEASNITMDMLINEIQGYIEDKQTKRRR